MADVGEAADDGVGGVAELIRRRRQQLGLSLRSAAERIGINNGYLSQLESGQRSRPSAEVLNAIARGLALPIDAVYRVAGLLDGDVTEKAVESAIESDAGLTGPQKDSLLVMYRSFVEVNSVGSNLE